jgi:hypothetical protein
LAKQSASRIQCIQAGRAYLAFKLDHPVNKATTKMTERRFHLSSCHEMTLDSLFSWPVQVLVSAAGLQKNQERTQDAAIQKRSPERSLSNSAF